MKNWKTTLAGSIFAILSVLSNQGVKLGRIGNTDFIALAAGTAGVAFAAAAKDKNVTGGTKQQ